MAGRPKKAASVSKYKEVRGRRSKPYNHRPVDTRGLVGKEAHVFKGFWKDHSMDDIMVMDLELVDAEIEIHLDEFIKRQLKSNKRWNFPDIS